MKKYIEVMDHIRPTDVQKKQMLENAFSKANQKRKIFRFKYGLIAALICVIFSTAVFADEIKNTFYGIFNSDNIVGDKVLNDIYTDGNDHVKMSVKEVLSDKISAYAIVEYTALDEKGRIWLDNLHAVQKLNPLIKDNNGSLYGVNFSYGFEEIEKYRSEKIHVFKVMYHASGENFGTESIQLSYPLCNKWENKVIIDVSESLRTVDIKIDGSQAPDKYYKPLGIKLSPISVLIYGKDLGMIEFGKTASGGYYQKIVHYEELDSLNLILKDGSIYNMLLTDNENMVKCQSMMTHVGNPALDYDCIIYTGIFKDSIDISLIKAIELDGVYYDLN